MAAGRYSFNIEQGSTTVFDVIWKDSNSAYIDLADCEAVMDIRTNYSQSGGDTVLSLTSSIGDTYSKASGSAFLSLSGSNLTTNLNSGSIGIYIGYDITKTLTAEDYFYDLEITNTSDEQRWRLIEGKIKIKKQVTSANPQ